MPRLQIRERSQSEMTFSQQIETFLAETDISKTSRDNYRRWLRPFHLWVVNSDVDINHITPADILRYKDHISNLKDKTINCYLTAIRMFFKWHAANNHGNNVAASIRLVRIRKTYRKIPLTLSQLINLINTCPDNQTGNRSRAIIMLMAQAGLRSIEVSRIKKQHIKGNKLTIHGKGHNSPDHTFTIDDELLRAISKQIHNQSDYLFSTLRGHKLTAKRISQVINQQIKQSGIDDPHISTHSLRHTAAVFAYHNSDKNIRKVKDFMRHTSIRTTEIYLQSILADTEQTDTIIREIGEMIAQAMKQSETGNKQPTTTKPQVLVCN